MAASTITDLTEGKLDGNGVFDELMRSFKAHIHEEYSKNRLTGAEYATVYLGGLQTTMEQALQYLLQRRRSELEADLVAEKIKTEVLGQERLNKEIINLGAQKLQIDAQTELLTQQGLNAEKERDQIVAQTELVEQQTSNAILEGKVLVAQECKLRMEYDLLAEQKLKTVAETALLNQKKVTELSQTSGSGIDEESQVGSQIALYKAQRDGFKRDAEQKAAKLMSDVWAVQRTTDEGIQASTSNGLQDANIARAINKMLEGVNA